MARHPHLQGFIQYPTVVYVLMFLLIWALITAPLFYGALDRLEAQNIHPGILGFVCLFIACSLTGLLFFFLFSCATILLAYSIERIGKRRRTPP